MTEWSFHYAGPQDEASDASCLMCVGAVLGACPHAKKEGHVNGCAGCVAAAEKRCPAHSGLVSALEHHHEIGHPEFVECATIAREAMLPGASSIVCDLRGSSLDDGAHVKVDRHIELLIRK